MLQIIDQKPDSSQILLPFPPSPPQYDLKSYYPTGPQRVPVADGPPKEPLGNHTNFQPTYAPKIDTETHHKAFRRLRFRLLEMASQTSPKGHRIRGCCKHPSKDEHGELVEKVYIDIGPDKARWRKVTTCKLGWICPICAPRIMARKQEELQMAQRLHRQRGGSCILVTYTYRHRAGNNLKSELDLFSATTSAMKSHGPFDKLREKTGLVGIARSVEIPHGDNGWHPHAHEAWFVKSGLTEQECKTLETDLFNTWYDHCKSSGLGLPSRARGIRVDYRESDNPADDCIGAYLTKMSQEMTGNVHKSSKMGGRTYFEIVHSMLDKWTPKDAALAREYMVGTKGKSQHRWSRGLRASLGLDEALEQSDKEKEAAKEPLIARVGVTIPQWYAIATARLQGRVLEVAEDYGSAVVREYIELIHQQDTGALDRIRAGRAKRKQMAVEPTHTHMCHMGMKMVV